MNNTKTSDKSKVEKVGLEPQVTSNPAFLEKYPKPAIIYQSHLQGVISRQQLQEQIKIIDVYGQEAIRLVLSSSV